MAKVIGEGSVPASNPLFSVGPLIASSPQSSQKFTTEPGASSDAAALPNPMQEVEDGMEEYLLKRLAEASAQAGSTPSQKPETTTELPKSSGTSGDKAVESVNWANEKVKARMAKLFAEGKLRPECYLDPKTGKPR